VAESARASAVPPSSTLDLQLAGGPRHSELTTAALFAHAFGGHQGHILVDKALRLAINRACAGTVRSVGQKAIAAKPARVHLVSESRIRSNCIVCIRRSFDPPSNLSTSWPSSSAARLSPAALSSTSQAARRRCVFGANLTLFDSTLLRCGCDRPHDFATPSCVARRAAMRSRTRSKRSLATVDVRPFKMH